MLKRIPYIVVSVLLFTVCTQEKPDIRVACETNSVNGCTRIKWEIFPHIEGTVKIYESSSPDSFNLYSPVAKVAITDGFREVFSFRTLERSYYKLLFNDRYSVITSERILCFSEQGPFNFRDLGGYYNENNQQVRWGKLYRSSSLSRLAHQDVKALKNLNIKTIIDLRTETERYNHPYRYQAKHVVSLPLRGNPNAPVFWFDKILSEQIRKGDVVSYLTDVNLFFLENNSEYFHQLFDILTDTSNYPIVMNCTNGNDRTGVASALVLFALGIDWNQTLDDWLLSDKLMNYYSISSFGNPEMYPEHILETLTAMFREPKETFIIPFEKVVKDHGSIDKFLETECGLTVEKKTKLRNLLLYP
ncbi:MAG: tyrosine-protein phosphatase [Dysgonamonadaceae bacterium]|jgi:protein-tyrosine phosphatase|nr:tyrosine-protein phosphatase [Dysgonamonadaceae bacterium]